MMASVCLFDLESKKVKILAVPAQNASGRAGARFAYRICHVTDFFFLTQSPK